MNRRTTCIRTLCSARFPDGAFVCRKTWIRLSGRNVKRISLISGWNFGEIVDVFRKAIREQFQRVSLYHVEERIQKDGVEHIPQQWYAFCRFSQSNICEAYRKNFVLRFMRNAGKASPVWNRRSEELWMNLLLWGSGIYFFISRCRLWRKKVLTLLSRDDKLKAV